MNEKIYAVQIRHLRRCLAALRLLDLPELQRAAEDQGSQADRDLIAAIILALETVPDDTH